MTHVSSLSGLLPHQSPAPTSPTPPTEEAVTATPSSVSSPTASPRDSRLTALPAPRPPLTAQSSGEPHSVILHLLPFLSPSKPLLFFFLALFYVTQKALPTLETLPSALSRPQADTTSCSLPCRAPPEWLIRGSHFHSPTSIH